MLSKSSSAERYRRRRLLGEGGAGRVTLVEDLWRGGTLVALKELLDPTPEGEQALRREFATLASLRHPSLVEALDFESDAPEGRGPRFTLEFVEGVDLVATVRREGSSSLVPLAAEALRALALLHDFGVIHRDVKPANLLVRGAPRRGARVVVLDFGLAAQGGAEKRVRAGMAGTLPYLAPELFEGADATRRTDLYALGAVLFEAVHGRPPIALKGNDTGAFVAAVREGRRARPSLPAGYAAGLGPWLDRLLALDPGERPADAAAALASLSEACGSFVPVETPASRAGRLESGPPPGRSVEESALWAHIAPGDSPRVVWLAGGAGSGKSRMLRWLSAEGVGRGYEVFAPPPGTDLLGALDRLRETAAQRPALVLLDEVESSGAGAVEFLERVAREPKGAPLRVVAAVRPGEVRIPALRKLLGDTGTVPTLRRVDLEPLGAPGLHAMAERATGRGPSEARLKWLVDATEGNALLAATCLAEGVWEKGGRERRSVALEKSIELRVARLSDAGRRWLEAVAVAGPGVEETRVAEIAEIEDETRAGAAEQVALSGLARAVHGAWSAESRLTAQTVLQSMDAESRRAMHAAAAERLQSRSDPVEADLLARLWGEAGDGVAASGWAIRAGDAAAGRYRPGEASERYRLALRHLPRRSPQRALVREKQAEALFASSAYDAAVRAFGAARGLAREPEQRLRLAIRQGHAIARSAAFRRGLDRGKSVAESCRAAGFPLLAAEALQVSAICLSRDSRHAEAIALLREATEIVRGGPADMEARAFSVLGVALGNASDPEAEAVLERAVALTRSVGDRDGFLKSVLALSRLARAGGRSAESLRLLEEARRLAEQSSNLPMAVYATLRMVALAHDGERLDLSLSLGAEAYDQSLHLGDDALVATSRNYLASALNDIGRYGETIALFDSADVGSAPRVDTSTRISGGLALAIALVRSGPVHRQRAVELLRVTLETGRGRLELRNWLRVLAAEIERRSTAVPPEAFDDLVYEFRTLERSEGALVEDDARFVILHAIAGAFLLSGTINAVFEPAADALAIAERNDWPGKSALASHLLAEAYRAAGGAEESEEHAQRASKLLMEAATRIADPAVRDDFLAQSRSRVIRERRDATGGERRLAALYDMIRALNSQTDPEALLESILDMALRAVAAVRGMILLTAPGGGEFSVRLSRNLEPETAADVEQFSRTIVAQAGAGQSVLALDAGQDERFRDLKSISLFRIRSLMCVPLRSRGTIVGTVYLDSRREGRLFSKEDLRFVEAFADHAALALENARARAELERENRRLRAVAGERASYGAIVGRSAAMQKIFDLLDTISQSELPVLIQGESGTGKELVARAIHFNGPRKSKQFLSENCAAIPESLLESELFGHVRGAFTGAERDRAGLFEQADGGTLFLDEVGDMSPGMQARLLRVLQEGEIRRVGGEGVLTVDVRVIAATNKDLSAAVTSGRFREDLYYRLNVLTVDLPPLRTRTGDVTLIAGHLLERISRERSRPVPRIDTAVLDLLERYEWPGNVRQLENTIQRLALLAGSGPLTADIVDGDDQMRRMLRGVSVAGPILSLEKSERDQIRRALEESSGNRDRAARLLGISRATIYRKLREYGLS